MALCPRRKSGVWRSDKDGKNADINQPENHKKDNFRFAVLGGRDIRVSVGYESKRKSRRYGNVAQ